MYKLLIVDDEPLVQVGIKSMIDYSKFNLSICGLAGNGLAALDIIKKETPDIVICDIKMPIMSGLELIRNCRETYGYLHPAFIFLTSYEEFQMAKEALRYQASDYLVKLELTSDILEKAIEKAISFLEETKTVASSLSENTADAEERAFANDNELFYIKLLQNIFENPEQFQAHKNYLGISFDAAGYQCAYLEFFNAGNQSLAQDKQYSLYLTSCSLLRELLEKYLSAKVISLDLQHCAIIFDITHSSTGYFPDTQRITEVLTILQESLRKYYNIIFKAGIGSVVEEPINISASYQYAKQAYSYVDNDQAFLFIDECFDNDYAHQTFNFSIFREPLTQAFEEFDEIKLCSIIDELCDLFITYPKRNFQALDAACSILYTTISSLPNGEKTVTELFCDYPDSYRSIYRQRSTEQIVSWLEAFKHKISDYFMERKSSHTNYTVTMVKKYINEHISEKLTLNDIAAQFGITPNYLSQLFKKYNNVGFNEYVTATKINEAKKLMFSSNLKLYEISDLLGFESSFYFSKVFKKIEGISPKDYMNQKL